MLSELGFFTIIIQINFLSHQWLGVDGIPTAYSPAPWTGQNIKALSKILGQTSAYQCMIQ